jgi:hypothetical protein
MKKYTLILSILLLSACELIVDIDVPFESPQLTVNSFFTPDSVWSATVALNRHILDEKPLERIDNALLIVFDGDTPIDTLENKTDGKYRSDSGKPVAGKHYSIRCEAQGYASVTGRSVIQEPAIISDVIIQTTSTNFGSTSLIRIKFPDDPKVKNYYQLFVESGYERVNLETGEKKFYYNSIPLESADPDIYSQSIQIHNSFLIKDILFNGKEAELVYKSEFGLNGNAGIRVLLRTVSEDFYKYKSTTLVQEETADNPFAQPVNVYKNIENGFGIFAGYSTSVYEEISPEPIIHEISPLKGKPGDTILITGENFGVDVYSFTSVVFTRQGQPYGAYGGITERDDHHIRVTVPQDATTGKIVVYANDRVALSDVEFEVL